MAGGSVTPGQVYQQVISQGGSTTQAQVAAALVSGIESNGTLNDQNPTSTASGLFQFLDTTWDNYGGVSHAGNATFQQQVAKFISESGGPGGNNFYAWAPDLGGSYNGSGTYSTIGGQVAQVIQKDSASWGAAAPATNMTQADWAAHQAAGQAGGTQYLESLNSQQNSAGSTAAASGGTGAANQAGDETINIPGLGPETVTAQQASAYDTITADLTAYGFNTAQTAQLAQWAWGEITNNVDPTQVAIDLQTPGTLGYSVFEQVYPGFVGANAQLTAQGLPAVSVQQYAQYQTQAQAMAQAAGLPAGFLNSQNIGTLIGGNVSTQELSSRINNALTLAYNSTPEQQETFNQYFGANYGSNNPYATGANTPTGSGALTPGQIAAIALDPSVAEPLIAQQITAGQIGGASVTSGVGALGATTATQLAQAGITEAQATNAFQNLAPYSTLEQARPGLAATTQGVVSPQQLATGALLGTAGAQRQLQTAEEVAKAPFSGGGGFVSNAKGVAGAGSASDVGAGNT